MGLKATTIPIMVPEVQAFDDHASCLSLIGEKKKRLHK